MSAEPLPSRPVFPLRPVPAKASLRRRRVVLPAYLPARMLNEFTYCPRLFFYEWVEGVFAHNAETVEGALRHETLGEKAEAMAPAGEGNEERIHARSVSLSSDRHGLTAVIDLVEGEGNRVSPIDYKRGAPREADGALAAWPTEGVQVCVQALLLRDQGYTCDEAVVYYNQTKQRVRVAIDEELVTATLRAVEDARRSRSRVRFRRLSSTAPNASGVPWSGSVFRTKRVRCCTAIAMPRSFPNSSTCSPRRTPLVSMSRRLPPATCVV